MDFIIFIIIVFYMIFSIIIIEFFAEINFYECRKISLNNKFLICYINLY